MDHKSVLVMRHRVAHTVRNAMEAHASMNVFERVFAFLFPPRQKPISVESLRLIGEYQERMARTGVEPIPGQIIAIQLGEIVEHRRPLTKWDKFSRKLKGEVA